MDLGVNKSDFSFDRWGRHHISANEHVLKTKRLHPIDGAVRSSWAIHSGNSDDSCNSTNNIQNDDNSENNDVSNAPFDVFSTQSRSSNSTKNNEMKADGRRDSAVPSFDMKYSIKILAYNRPRSLQRLLASLLRADYLTQNVSIAILIDGGQTEEDTLQVDDVIRIAEQFRWPHGTKSLIKNDRNVGLAGQWHFAWQPVANNEAAFVFEDDVAVSPFFFKWSSQAVSTYYTSTQREHHYSLLMAVRAQISANRSSENNGDEFHSPIDRFAAETSGHPVLYGICLQKQVRLL